MRKYLFLLFVFSGCLAVAQDITRVEYYIDTDPGYGNGTSVSIIPSPTITDLSFNIDITAESDGFHTLHFRAKDTNDDWSSTLSRPFYKISAAVLATEADIDYIEYYIDADPGAGAATSLPITPSVTITDYSFAIPLTSFTDGFHTLTIRARDANLGWSTTLIRPFYKISASALATEPDIDYLEYYLDTDPGYGNGTSITITAAPSITDLSFSIDITAETEGFHTMHFRTKDADGDWSTSISRPFYKIGALQLASIPDLTKLEYFIDDDPGFGAGIDVPITAGATVTGLDVTIPVTDLADGDYLLSFRGQDANGNWSLITVVNFSVGPPPTITGFANTSGDIGDIITITGTNFSAALSENTVSFNGTSATINSATTTTLTAVVPVGATSGPITVAVKDQAVTSVTDFTVTNVPDVSGTTDILAYSFSEQNGSTVIGSGTVDINASFGTNVSALIADFTLSVNATATIGLVTQENGVTANDFTNPVTYTVTAEDGSTTQDWLVTVTEQPLDLANPEINASNLPEVYESGSASLIPSIDVTDNIGLSSVSFYSRRLNATNFTEKILSAANSTYSNSLSESQVSDIGIEYFFYAIDGNENDVSTDTIQVHIHYMDDTSPPISNLSSGGKAANWRMFSLPFELDSKTIAGIVESVYGSYDDTKWRMFHYKNDTEGFVEYPKGLASIERGKGYWFNSVEKRSISVGSGTAPLNNSKDLASISLTAGWNQIGNPYAFDVSWDNVLNHNNIDDEVESNIRVFTGGTALSNSTTLKAFGGAYVLASQPMVLDIPLTVPSGGRIQDRNDFTDGWLLTLSLEAGVFSNDVTSLGMHPEATINKDGYDQIRAPRFSSYIDASFNHPEFFMPNFSRDIVADTESFVWEFTVTTNIEDKLRFINWNNPEYSGDQKLILIDQNNGNVIDMVTANSYSYANDKSRKFKIVYGDEKFLISQFKEDNIYLGANYPNPFNSSTTIPYSIYGKESEYHVKINIYSINGRLVKTLVDKTMPSGIYSANWDTREHSGNSLTGMFIYSLEVKTAQGVQSYRMKMIVQ